MMARNESRTIKAPISNNFHQHFIAAQFYVMIKSTDFPNGACVMMSYEEFTQSEAALESAPRAEREAFYAEILERRPPKPMYG